MDFSNVREPTAPFAPLGRVPADGEPFAVDDQGMVLVRVGDVPHPPFFKKEVLTDKVLTLEESDIVVATYPKCGTTWMQQVVLLMLARGDKAQIGDIMQQAPWFEMKYAMGGAKALLDVKPSVGGRRVWKTHAKTHQLPWAGSAGKKIIVTRNPFDAAVSMHHHARDVGLFKYSGDWGHFLGLYSKGMVESGDFWSWHGGWLQYHQDPSNDTFWVCFEDMKDDLPKVIRDLATFLGMELDEETVTKVAEGSGFDVMKKQFEELDAKKIAAGEGHKVKKNHIRKGESGAWKKTFTEGQEEEFRALHIAKCKDNKLPLELFKRC